jgi:hypothetical protein
LLAAIIIFGGVTLLFALWEYLEFRFRYSDRWKPETLGPVPVPGARPEKARPVVQVIGGIAWLTFAALALYSPWFFWFWGGRGVFSPSEALYTMRIPLWLLAFFAISQSWLGYTRFAAGKWRGVLRLGLAAAGARLAIFLRGTGDLLVAGPIWNPARAHSLATLNQMIAAVLVLGSIVAGLALLQTFIRVVRCWSNPRTPGLAS